MRRIGKRLRCILCPSIDSFSESETLRHYWNFFSDYYESFFNVHSSLFFFAYFHLFYLLYFFLYIFFIFLNFRNVITSFLYSLNKNNVLALWGLTTFIAAYSEMYIHVSRDRERERKKKATITKLKNEQW